MRRLEQNFIGLIVLFPFGKRESLYINEEKGEYGWVYEYVDYRSDDDRTFIAEGAVERDFYADARKVLMNFKVQPYLKFGASGLDGVIYTLIMGDHLVESRFSWREKLLEEWAAFVPILDDLYRNLRLGRQQLDADGTFPE